MGWRGVNDGFLICNELNDELVFLDKRDESSLIWHCGAFRDGVLLFSVLFGSYHDRGRLCGIDDILHRRML